MSILKRVEDPDIQELPNLAVIAKPQPINQAKSTSEAQRKRVPTQRVGYFTYQFATLNLRYYKDKVYVPEGCCFDLGATQKPKILRQAERLQGSFDYKANRDEIRRLLELDQKVAGQYSSIIKQRASQPTQHRRQFIERQKEAMQKSAFFYVDTRNPSQNSFKRDFLTPDDACLLQGGYKLQHNNGKQLAYAGNAYNRVNGRMPEPQPIYQLPQLFSSREALYECAVTNSVVSAFKAEAEKAENQEIGNGGAPQFMTEVPESAYLAHEEAKENSKIEGFEPQDEEQGEGAAFSRYNGASENMQFAEERFESDWNWEENAEQIGEFGDMDGI